MTIKILVKNHREVNIEDLDRDIFNGIDIKHFELNEMDEEYLFKYKGEWREVVAICIYTSLITIEVKEKLDNDEEIITEKTVKFHLNLVKKEGML